MTVMPLLRDDPSRLGEFRLHGRLGAGGMGVVFLGEDKGGSPVAIKVLRSDFASDESFRVRFRREVAAARRVDGPCTARMIAADLDAPQPYFVSEYIEGPTLDAYCREFGPLEGEALDAFALGIADALWAIHTAGLIHRDLKPSNILLGDAGPKVIDFGVTLDEAATAITRVGQSVGSPGWMAPEQARGERVGRPVDVFAWGAVVAFAATASPPFGLGSADAVLYRVVHDAPSLDSVPDSLRSLVAAALDKDPQRRPDSSEIARSLLPPGASSDSTEASTIVRQALDASWTIAAPTGVQPVPPVLAARGRSRPWARALVLLAGIVILVGAGTTWALSRRAATETPAVDVSRTTVTTTTVIQTTTTTAAPVTTTTVPVPASTLPVAPQNGIYVNGPQGTPRYFIAVSHDPDGTLVGAVSFLFQNGQTAPIFSFSGPQQDGVATVQRDDGGAPISVVYGPTEFQLGQCTEYFEFAQSLAECTFNYSPQGLL